MTNEEKAILLKDLCARLPYGVICEIDDRIRVDEDEISIPCDKPLSFSNLKLFRDNGDFYIKPYLRPMDSMTDGEFQELHSICPHSTFNKTNVPGWIVGIAGSDYGRISRIDEISKLIDWLNKKGFDYRGLIPMGLALPAKEGMYNKMEE